MNTIFLQLLWMLLLTYFALNTVHSCTDEQQAESISTTSHPPPYLQIIYNGRVMFILKAPLYTMHFFHEKKSHQKLATKPAKISC
jgi:hypothetical protein